MFTDRHADPIHGYTDSVDQLLCDRRADRALRSAIAAARAAEESDWTPEITIARRAAWNNLVKATAGKKMTAMQVAGLEKQAGFTLSTLKTHIARHGL